jgi:AcrR family transcriptional regulator
LGWREAGYLGSKMTRTPWGESTKLRERMMVSGPRAGAEAAAQNQRERLFGAMVANCTERGYEATRVSDLVGLSGVSRRDFYRHFSDKQDCFLATMDAILAAALATLRVGGEGALGELIALAGEQPAAARLCLIESFAAGEQAVARMEAAVAAAEALYAQAIEDRGGGHLPREACIAIVGGVREVLRNHLRHGREVELHDQAGALWTWAFRYREPPATLPRPHPSLGAPGSYLPEDPAERIIRALAEVSAEKGYPATTIGEIVARAQVSLSTFYARFDSKQAAFLAALDAGQARMLGVALAPYRRARDWPDAVRAAFEAMFAFFAAEPAFARLAIVEVFAAGEQALAQREQMLGALEVFLAPGFELVPGLDPIVAEAIGGATNALVYARIRAGGVERLGELAPMATYLTLSPFIGAEEAAAVARGRR